MSLMTPAYIVQQYTFNHLIVNIVADVHNTKLTPLFDRIETPSAHTG